MNNKIKIMIIGVVSYFLISLIVLVINNSNRYIIVSNDFMFKVSNKSIKKVDKYPKYLNDKNVLYYDNGKKNNGYIHINKDGKINYYSKEYDRVMVNYYTLSSINNKKIKLIELKDEMIDSKDDEIINNYLLSNDINSEKKYTFVKKVKIKKNEYLYLISNHYTDEDIMNSYISKPDDLSYEVSFIYKNNKSYTLFQREGLESGDYSILSSIFDYNNDGNYEIAFINLNYDDHYCLCAEVYYLDNNGYTSEENCNLIVKQGVD
ncbi:MAG: hypothetical protein IKE73_04780 [Bacilli bacterium]|nr:hypothetical protein [Bacilli bacterium]